VLSGFLILFSFVAKCSTGKICITFDDLPVEVLSNKTATFQQQVTDSLISSFRKYKVPAIGFVNEDKLYGKDKRLDSVRVALLQSWLKAKLELGNHTYSHPDYNKTSCQKYSADILAGEKITRPLMKHYHKKLRYFRHPFLSIGESKVKSDSLNAFLAAHKYIVAPVTVENDDWLFNDAYDSAFVRKDTMLMHQIGHSYLEYTEKQLRYSEELSQKVFKRNISQILLLHANAINKDYFAQIAELFKTDRYKFVTIEQALKDKAYRSQITEFGDWGSLWLLRWAVSNHVKGNLYADLPHAPEYVLRLAGQLSYYK